MSAARYSGLRVAIVGGCQVAGIGEWSRRMLPGADVRFWHVNVGPSATPEVIEPQIADCDLVVTQLAAGMNGGGLEVERLRQRFANVVFLPVVVFSGFHPDSTIGWAISGASGHVRGPLDVFQSALAIACFKLGLPAARVPRLFNKLIFQEFGYMERFAGARAAFLSVYAGHGYELSGAFDAWMRDGAFMYYDNHPHLRVLGTFARLVLEKAGLEPADVPAAQQPADALANSIQCPIYPAIAQALGIPGSTDFVRSVHAVPAGEPRALSLRAFIDASYQAFSAIGRADLGCEPQVAQQIDTLRGLITA